MVRISEGKTKEKLVFLCFSYNYHLPLFFFGAKKRGKRNIHLPPSPPYMEGLN